MTSSTRTLRATTTCRVWAARLLSDMTTDSGPPGGSSSSSVVSAVSLRLTTAAPLFTSTFPGTTSCNFVLGGVGTWMFNACSAAEACSGASRSSTNVCWPRPSTNNTIRPSGPLANGAGVLSSVAARIPTPLKRNGNCCSPSSSTSTCNVPVILALSCFKLPL